MAPAPIPAVTLRPATAGDRFMINRWLADPEVVAWFGTRAAAEATLALARETPSALVRIIEGDGAAIGYAQGLELEPAGRRAPAPLVVGTVELDAFVGEVAFRRRGIGAGSLAQLRDEVFATTFAPAVVVRVPITREDVVRRIEKAGFRWTSIENDPVRGPCWLLTAMRPTVR